MCGYLPGSLYGVACVLRVILPGEEPTVVEGVAGSIQVLGIIASHTPVARLE